MYRLKPLLFSAMIALITCSCGQKGPLYLPESDNAGRQAEAEEIQDEENNEKNEENS